MGFEVNRWMPDKGRDDIMNRPLRVKVLKATNSLDREVQRSSVLIRFILLLFLVGIGLGSLLMFAK